MTSALRIPGTELVSELCVVLPALARTRTQSRYGDLGVLMALSVHRIPY